MKKGFTLIELAIALMVIGLILGMAMKGRAVVDSAEIKSDLNKVRKLKAAVTSYYAKYKILPGVIENTSGTGSALTLSPKSVYDDLVEEGLATESDFYSALERKTIAIFSCYNTEYSPGHRDTPAKGWDIAPRLCLGVTETEMEDLSHTSTAAWGVMGQYSDVFTCYLESQMDDGDFLSGKGLGVRSGEYDFTDCENAKPVASYSYLLF